jgi:hypothetical protein
MSYGCSQTIHMFESEPATPSLLVHRSSRLRRAGCRLIALIQARAALER